METELEIFEYIGNVATGLVRDSFLFAYFGEANCQPKRHGSWNLSRLSIPNRFLHQST